MRLTEADVKALRRDSSRRAFARSADWHSRGRVLSQIVSAYRTTE